MLPTGRSHYMYGGSVTTPPCTEGLRWHVFSEPIAVPVATLQQLQTGLAQTFGPEGSQDIANYRTNNRLTQDANGRPIFQCGALSASPASVSAANHGLSSGSLLVATVS